MKATTPTAKGKALHTATVAFLIALCLSAPVHASDIELEPYGVAETSTRAFENHDPAAVDTEAPDAAAPHASASRAPSDRGERAAASADAGGLTLTSFFSWIYGLLSFGG